MMFNCNGPSSTLTLADLFDTLTLPPVDIFCQIPEICVSLPKRNLFFDLLPGLLLRDPTGRTYHLKKNRIMLCGRVVQGLIPYMIRYDNSDTKVVTIS